MPTLYVISTYVCFIELGLHFAYLNCFFFALQVQSALNESVHGNAMLSDIKCVSWSLGYSCGNSVDVHLVTVWNRPSYKETETNCEIIPSLYLPSIVIDQYLLTGGPVHVKNPASASWTLSTLNVQFLTSQLGTLTFVDTWKSVVNLPPL